MTLFSPIPGRSERLEVSSGYTVESMVEGVEAVRVALGLGKISLLGHSYGGVLAQAHALKYQGRLSHLLLCSTFHSTRRLNEVFVKMKANMAPELRAYGADGASRAVRSRQGLREDPLHRGLHVGGVG
jgi:pimeloyl-ACP methyl ester carboxylesterase